MKESLRGSLRPNGSNSRFLSSPFLLIALILVLLILLFNYWSLSGSNFSLSQQLSERDAAYSQLDADLKVARADLESARGEAEKHKADLDNSQWAKEKVDHEKTSCTEELVDSKAQVETLDAQARDCKEKLEGLGETEELSRKQAARISELEEQVSQQQPQQQQPLGTVDCEAEVVKARESVLTSAYTVVNELWGAEYANIVSQQLGIAMGQQPPEAQQPIQSQPLPEQGQQPPEQQEPIGGGAEEAEALSNLSTTPRSHNESVDDEEAAPRIEEEVREREDLGVEGGIMNERRGDVNDVDGGNNDNAINNEEEEAEASVEDGEGGAGVIGASGVDGANAPVENMEYPLPNVNIN